MKYETKFHDLFHNPDLADSMTDAELLAHGLGAWAMCMGSSVLNTEPIPSGFGDAMVKIGERLGCSADPDSLMEFSNSYKV